MPRRFAALAIAASCSNPGRSASVADGELTHALARTSDLPRRFAARTSLPVAYRPCRDSSGAGGVVAVSICDEHVSPPSEAVLALASRASTAVRRAGSVDALHAAALIELLWPDAEGKSLDRSISFLSAASRTPSSAADVRADLAAAYLARAELRQDPRDLLAAAENSMLALDLDSTSQPARFNLALSLSRLRVHAAATREWDRLSAQATESSWKGEVARRRTLDDSIARARPLEAISDTTSRELIARLAATDPQRVRMQGWDDLLPRWGEATLAGDSIGAARWLGVARVAGAALVSGRHDGSLAAATKTIAESGTRRAVLALGHAAYGHGRRAYELNRYATAAAAFDSAIACSAPSPTLRLAAMLWKGIVLSQDRNPDASQHLLQKVLESRDTATAGAIIARARWSSTGATMRNGDLRQTLDLLRGSQSLYRSLGERENLGTAEHLEALTYLITGEKERVLATLMRSMDNLRWSRTSVRLHNALYLLGDLATYLGLAHTALLVRGEDVDVARLSGDPLNVAEALAAVARVEHSLDDTAAVGGALREARAALDSAPEVGGKTWVKADLLLAEADRDVRSDPETARAELDTAIAFFRGGVGAAFRVLPALQVRAEASLALGDLRGAQRDLEEVLATVGREIGTTADQSSRYALANSAELAYGRLALLKLARGATREALQVVEDGRSMVNTFGPRLARSQRPPDAADPILDLALLGDTLVRWLVRGDSITVHRTPVDRQHLRGLIARTRSLLELRIQSPAVTSNLAELFEVLLRPVASELPDSGGALTIVADGEIGGAPLAAAYDTARRRYLIQRAVLRFAPTLDIAGQAATPKHGAQGSALIVADPAFDRRTFPGLSRLRGAVGEADDLMTRYPDALLLADTAATWPRFKSAVPRASVVHVSGHALLDENNPWQSQLVFAPMRARDEVRTTPDSLAALDLHRVDLVVLSACESARESAGRAAALLGFSAALLHAGARGVIGGLWRIDDEDTRAFMRRLHESYRASHDGAAALREAQLAFLRSENADLRSPSMWAGFKYVGRGN